jgi:hypothetical protein
MQSAAVAHEAGGSGSHSLWVVGSQSLEQSVPSAQSTAGQGAWLVSQLNPSSQSASVEHSSAANADAGIHRAIKKATQQINRGTSKRFIVILGSIRVDSLNRSHPETLYFARTGSSQVSGWELNRQARL